MVRGTDWLTGSCIQKRQKIPVLQISSSILTEHISINHDYWKLSAKIMVIEYFFQALQQSMSLLL